MVVGDREGRRRRRNWEEGGVIGRSGVEWSGHNLFYLCRVQSRVDLSGRSPGLGNITAKTFDVTIQLGEEADEACFLSATPLLRN